MFPLPTQDYARAVADLYSGRDPGIVIWQLRLVLGISDEPPPDSDIERVRLVGEMIQGLVNRFMSTAPGETFTNPLDLKDRIGEYCFDVLAKTVREMKCHSGWLALLDEDGVSPTQVFANIRKQSVRILPPRLEPAWTIAVQVGLARIMSNFNPFTRRVLVPYYSGDKPVLLYILAGRLRPFNADDIARIASLGKNTWGELERIRYISQLEQAYEMTIQGWARSLEERDRTSVPGHYHLPVEWAMDLARALHLNETSIGHLRRGAVLHDIGTMSIPESILQKSGTLSPEEWAIVRRHPILGAEMVAGTLFLIRSPRCNPVSS